MFTTLRNFTPTPVGGKALAASTTSASTALVASPLQRKDVIVYNSGSVAAFIEFGGSTVAAVVPSGATPGGLSVPPGAALTLCAGDNTHIAAITASSTATLYITSGCGN